jgi:eukaryotic-like serine/threonine-protein kinase
MISIDAHGKGPMNRVNPAAFETLDRETVVQPAPNAVEPADASSPKREIVAGSTPHLTKETQGLLRIRLRGAALMLLLGFGLFLVRHVAGVLSGEPVDSPLLSLHVLVVLVLAFVSIMLCRRSPLSMRTLRVAELVVFSFPAILFLLLQHRVTLSEAARGFMPAPMPFWLLLIFTYGMFIPNTWRRAVWVVGAMALGPVLLVVAMILTYPQVAQTITAIAFMNQAFVMVIAAVAATFGTHLINTLRREVFEAKQLGQYRLIAPLGAGGMGEVHLAEHRMLKRPCAIKLIRPEQAGDPNVLARFEREVRMTARLSHWNTVEIFDYGRTEDGTFFYVMEYLPGLSLEDLLQRHGPLPAGRVVHLLRQTCHGLREAHAVGLIHRDIKPGNIFAAKRGGLYDVAKLLDFGLVKPVVEISSARLTQDGVISGTPLFMSPEQARGIGSLDARSDIYSLGAVAYALLTGRPPFEQTNPFDVMMAHARDEVVPPSRLRADVPADLERVVLRCLEKKPEDRFSDVDSLEQALAECAAADEWTQADAACWWQENEETRATRDAAATATGAEGSEI